MEATKTKTNDMQKYQNNFAKEHCLEAGSNPMLKQNEAWKQSGTFEEQKPAFGNPVIYYGWNVNCHLAMYNGQMTRGGPSSHL